MEMTTTQTHTNPADDEDGLCIRTITPSAKQTMIEAHGVKGWKQTTWSKFFDTQDELDTWVRIFDATVQGQKTITA